MTEYLLLLGADQFLRERAYASGKAIGDSQIWTAIQNAKYKYNAYFDFCIDTNPLSYEEIKKEIAYYQIQGYEPKSIVPLNDWTLEVANQLNRDYGLPYLEPKVIKACRNKHIMKSLFEKANIPTAKSIQFNDATELKECIKEFTFPVIIKPMDFGGSGGVYLANNEKECMDAYRKSKQIMETYADTFHVSKNKFLIETFIDSDDEVSVEVLCGHHFYEVITVTEKYLSPRPWFTEMGHLVPSHRYKNEDISKYMQIRKIAPEKSITNIKSNTPIHLYHYGLPTGKYKKDPMGTMYHLKGKYSVMARNVNPMGYYQMMAEPGSSGGSILNSKNEILGVHTFRIDSGDYKKYHLNTMAELRGKLRQEVIKNIK